MSFSIQTPQLLRDFFHLAEFQFDWSGASEDRDHHLQGFAIFVYLVHLAVKVGKGAVRDAYRLVLLELDFDLRLVLGGAYAIDDLVHFIFGKRRRIIGRSYETRYAWRGFHHMPHVVTFTAGAKAREVHLHQDITGIKHSLHGVLLAVTDFGDRLSWNDHLADFFLQTKRNNARLERLFYLALKTRIAVDDVPLHIRIDRFARDRLTRIRRVCGRSCCILLFHTWNSTFPDATDRGAAPN